MEVMHSWTVFVNENVSSVIVFGLVFLLAYFFRQRPAGIPPGPAFTLPFVGNLPLLIGGDILGTFRRLRLKHGDIYSFYFGNDLTIVINGYTLIQKAAVMKGEQFTGRPDFLMNTELVGGKRGLIFTDGAFWKRQRKFIHANLQEFGFGKSSFEYKILREVKHYIDFLQDKGDIPFDIKKSIQASVANIIFSIVCGRMHEYDDPDYQTWLHNSEVAAKLVLKVSVMFGCAPFLKYLPGDPLNIKFMEENMVKWDRYIRDAYEEHKETRDENDPRDFIDLFINEQKKTDNSDFSFEQLSAVSRDLFGAGAETTSTTIRWAILYLMRYSDIKERLQCDIDDVIPKNRLPHLDDKAKLPYVEAFIMEVLRFANVAPLALPHSLIAENDISFAGYRIPRNCSVLFNLDSVLRDPYVFENPTEFRPERFIDGEGNLVRPKEFIPFGIGRRVCLGETVAKMELFLFLTSMIKYFDFVLPENSAMPDLEGVLGITNAPKPFQVRFLLRAQII